MAYIRTAQINKSVKGSCVPDSFYFVSWERLARRSVQSYKEWSCFCSFSRLGDFPPVFGQVKEWLILELYETIRVLYVVAFPLFFVLWSRWERRNVQSYEKWSFLSVFSPLRHFPQHFGQVKYWPLLELQEI